MNNLRDLDSDSSRRAALLVGRILSVFSFLAPCRPATRRPYLRTLFKDGPSGEQGGAQVRFFHLAGYSPPSWRGALSWTPAPSVGSRNRWMG